jgi:hypothetical protein
MSTSIARLLFNSERKIIMNKIEKSRITEKKKRNNQLNQKMKIKTFNVFFIIFTGKYPLGNDNPLLQKFWDSSKKGGIMVAREYRS